MPYIQVGMFSAKWAAKRFGDPATEDDPASWGPSSYFKGALGCALAGMLINAVKRGKGQLVLSGGLNLMAYKAIQNELIPTSGFWHDQLGAAEESYVPDEYLLTGSDDNPYAWDMDGNMMPADDRHRMPNYDVGSEALEPVTALGSEALEPVTALGSDPWQQAFIAQ
jgi:hypothetical protein